VADAISRQLAERIERHATMLPDPDLPPAITRECRG
jgi:hypothetical protein